MTEPRVALVHDFLLDLRGAERVFEVMCQVWPDADVYTAIYDELGTEGRFADRDVQTSWLQRLRPTAETFRPLLPLYPRAIESLDLSAYDLIVSSSSAWAHGVRKAPHATHVCYCHNPFRYAWAEQDAVLSARSPLIRPALRELLERWRSWDRRVSTGVDHYIANSELTRGRILRSFGRESRVLHPPIDLDRFSPGAVGDHYVVLGELQPHKRVDVAVEACTRLGLPLQVIGDGPLLRRLERIAGPTVQLRGRLSDAEVAEALRTCRAMIICAAEEFGLGAVEAMASGRPVIAVADGGVLETVEPGVTGWFFAHAEVDELVEALRTFDPLSVDPAACRAAAERFDVETFRSELSEIVDEALDGRSLIRA